MSPTTAGSALRACRLPANFRTLADRPPISHRNARSSFSKRPSNESADGCSSWLPTRNGAWYSRFWRSTQVIIVPSMMAHDPVVMRLSQFDVRIELVNEDDKASP